jgi:hypothetical protein
MLEDYNFSQDTIYIYCDNSIAISISKNHVQHIRIKHIDIRPHFIIDLVESKIVSLEHVNIEH